MEGSGITPTLTHTVLLLLLPRNKFSLCNLFLSVRHLHVNNLLLMDIINMKQREIQFRFSLQCS